MVVVLLAKQLAVLILLLLAAWGAGTLAAGSREEIAFRGALGLALLAHAMWLLAAVGQLRAVPLAALALVALAGGAVRSRGMGRPTARQVACALGGAPLFALALYPPLAFDETLYHLPFVRAFARDGGLRFLADVRYPVFPQLHELLCVAPFLLAGDAATHLVSLVETAVTAGLLAAWGRRYHVRAGWLAAAVFLGSPLVVHLATVLYAEAALALFVAAGFYALDRERFTMAGLFFGTACGVKYLGGYFALAALIIVVARATDRRAVARFVCACAAAALPTYAWIVFNTGNPVFPFFGASPWEAVPVHSMPGTERATGALRAIWDVTFSRRRMNLQPPVTPLLAVLVALVAAAAVRDVRARRLALVCLGWVMAFSLLPRDSRYLVPILPLLSVTAAVTFALRWPQAIRLSAILALAPGAAYAIYRIGLLGIPPATPEQRVEWVSRRVPEVRAILRAGPDRIYACGGEQLKGYAAGEFLGDHFGPWSYDRILGRAIGTAAIAGRLQQIDARYFLVAKRRCAPPRATGGMELVYEDAAAQLWRVPGGEGEGTRMLRWPRAVPRKP